MYVMDKCGECSRKARVYGGGGGESAKRGAVRTLMVRFVLWNACSRRRSIPVAQGKSAQAGMATRHARKGVWNVPCHNSPPAPQIRHARQLTRGKNGPKWPDMPQGGCPAGMVATTQPHQCRDHARAAPVRKGYAIPTLSGEIDVFNVFRAYE